MPGSVIEHPRTVSQHSSAADEINSISPTPSQPIRHHSFSLSSTSAFRKTFNAAQLKKLAYPLAYPFTKLKQKTLGTSNGSSLIRSKSASHKLDPGNPAEHLMHSLDHLPKEPISAEGIQRTRSKSPFADLGSQQDALIGYGSPTGASSPRSTTPSFWGKQQGGPPQGYLYIWAGRFKTWRKRFFVATTPGILLFFKSNNCKGKAATISLKDVVVQSTVGKSKQFSLVGNDTQLWLRCLTLEDKPRWVACLTESQEAYNRTRAKLHQLHSQGMLDEAVTPNIAEGKVPLALSFTAESELDQQQRRRIKQRLGERLAALRPLEHEVLRHMGVLQGQLQGLAAGLAGPPASQSHSNIPQQTTPSLYSFHSARSTSMASVPAPDSSQEGSGQALPNANSHSSPPNSRSTSPSRFAHRVPAAGAPVDGSPATTMQQVAQMPAVARVSVRQSLANVGAPVHTLPAVNLHQAVAQLLDCFKAQLQAEVLRAVELEAENEALKRSLAKSVLSSGLRKARSGRNTSQPVDEAPSDSGSDTFMSVAGDDSDGLLGLADDEITLSLGLHMGSQEVPAVVQGHLGSDEDDDMLDALELVHQVEYVSKSSALEPLMSELDAAEPPPEEAQDGPSSSEDETHHSRKSSATLEEQAVGTLRAEPRRRLPAPKPLGRGFSVWSMLKNAIGGDLTRITMPATINEPISFLQRLAEMMEYRALLEKVVSAPSSIERLLHMAAFAVSPYASQHMRENKPFNPLLGETFEWSDDNHRILMEQVSHHPPISAIYADGLQEVNGGYRISGEVELRTKFWGKSIQLLLAGHCQMLLPGSGDRFLWNRPPISVNDIILGRFWVDVDGDMVISNITTGECARLKLLSCRGKLENRGGLTGQVLTASGQVAYTLEGNIRQAVTATMSEAYAATLPPGDPRAGLQQPLVLFKANEPLEDAQEQYNMTAFAITLNEPEPRLMAELPPTDARFRPDQRALELGEFTKATAEKLRLEEKQRQARKDRKAAGQEYTPLWFDLVNPVERELVRGIERKGDVAWMFNGRYWGSRGQRSWDCCPDIY